MLSIHNGQSKWKSLMLTHAYMYTYEPQQMHTQTYIKIKKRKIVTGITLLDLRNALTCGVKEKEELMMVIWLIDALVLVLRGF